MDNKTRYDLMVKLSSFYVKNVQNHLEDFDKARKIANQYALLNSVLLFGLIFSLPLLIIPVFAVIPFFLFVLYFIISSNLDSIDEKNVVQVCERRGTTIVAPASGDKAIKEFLMPKFLEIFGDFKWTFGVVDKGLFKTFQDIKSLKVLSSPVGYIDDFIMGSYNGIDVKMLDANTSVAPIAFVIVVCIGLFLFSMPIIMILVASIFIPASKWLLLLFVPTGIVLVFFAWKFFFQKAFRGVIVKFDMNKEFEGHTFILEKDNPENKLAVLDSKYEQVKLEDIEFMNQYCVYSQNQIEARYLLTTAFLERLKKIKEIYNAKYIRAAFKNNQIIILIHTGHDMFQMAGKTKLSKESFVQLFNEICSVLDIIDVLKLNRKLGL